MCFTTFLCAIANGYDGSLMTGLIAVSTIIILILITTFLVTIIVVRVAVVVSLRSELPIDTSRDTQPDFRADLENVNGNLTGGAMHAIMTDGTVSERLPFGNYWVDGLGHLLDVHRVSRVRILVLLWSW